MNKNTNIAVSVCDREVYQQSIQILDIKMNPNSQNLTGVGCYFVFQYCMF